MHFLFIFVLLFSNLTAANAGTIRTTEVSPPVDLGQSLGSATTRWSNLYVKSIGNGEGATVDVDSLAEAARIALEKKHNELTAESRTAANSHPIGAITGLSQALQPATSTSSGVMSGADKAKLDGIDSSSIVYYTSEGDIRLLNSRNLLGTDLHGRDFNLIELSQWDIIDIGSSQHFLNLNSSDRPTIQLPGETGSEAENMAFLSDLAGFATVDNVESALAQKADLVGGRVPTSQLPTELISQTWNVASPSDLVSLTAATINDFARITDGDEAGHIYVLTAMPPTASANWVNISGSGDVIAVNGKTGAVTLDLADFPGVQSALNSKANTSALSSYATNAALSSGLATKANASDLALYATKASPTLTGTPTAPTAALETSTNQLATTAFVANAISSGGGGFTKITTLTSSGSFTATKTGPYRVTIIGGGGGGGGSGSPSLYGLGGGGGGTTIFNGSSAYGGPGGAGGWSGRSGSYAPGGAGGGGGQIVTVYMSLVAGNVYSVTIGAGGVGGSGGATSAAASANGGDTNYGRGGRASNSEYIGAGAAPGAGSGQALESASSGTFYGGGGGAGGVTGTSHGNGGGGGAFGTTTPSGSAAIGAISGESASPGAGGAGGPGAVILEY